ncbi:hypothetical protein [Chamaesiphon minutus]|uniref:Uncharacterized protein n=1 Tax=Chamaesiphon minutus (strain ATCC 27169 / PCC 6605) TaxID=1173020 RepID=K9UNN4_CHAP6|nr:hypothetical protein [Chamaesiphon minutus]AFY96435.1 hypothetical protein Cha6605_5559 [Chamaesiphon minutus PCC 6605]
MSLQYLQPFQVDPNRIERKEIANLVSKVSSNSKASEIHGLFDLNISLCAYLLNSYIKYDDIYFLSVNLISNPDNRPDYLCGCYHQQRGISWYAIVFAGPQEQTWDEDLQLTPAAKSAFDRLNYCTSNLDKILVDSQLAEEVDPEQIYGLLIIGQDKDFFHDRKKQERKRDINKKSPIKLRTYGAFSRNFHKEKSTSWLNTPVTDLLTRFR